MTAVQVAGLIEDAASVEIEATAVIPDLIDRGSGLACIRCSA
jgi:hypothetical protein